MPPIVCCKYPQLSLNNLKTMLWPVFEREELTYAKPNLTVALKFKHQNWVLMSKSALIFRIFCAHRSCCRVYNDTWRCGIGLWGSKDSHSGTHMVLDNCILSNAFMQLTVTVFNKRTNENTLNGCVQIFSRYFFRMFNFQVIVAAKNVFLSLLRLCHWLWTER